MQNHCPNCGKTTIAGARFCDGCGTALDATMAQERTKVMDAAAIPPSNPAAFSFTGLNAWMREDLSSNATRLKGGFTGVDYGERQEDTYVGVDVSGSMSERLDAATTKLQGAGRAGCNLVATKAGIDSSDRMGVITFNSHAKVLVDLIPLETGKRVLLKTLQSLQPGGGTDLATVLVAAQRGFDWSAQDVTRRVIVLTDGKGGDPRRIADKLKKRGVVIDVIGVGPDPSAVNAKLLKDIASVVEGELRYRFIKDHRTLVQHFTMLATKTQTGV